MGSAKSRVSGQPRRASSAGQPCTAGNGRCTEDRYRAPDCRSSPLARTVRSLHTDTLFSPSIVLATKQKRGQERPGRFFVPRRRTENARATVLSGRRSPTTEIPFSERSYALPSLATRQPRTRRRGSFRGTTLVECKRVTRRSK